MDIDAPPSGWVADDRRRRCWPRMVDAGPGNRAMAERFGVRSAQRSGRLEGPSWVTSRGGARSPHSEFTRRVGSTLERVWSAQMKRGCRPSPSLSSPATTRAGRASRSTPGASVELERQTGGRMTHHPSGRRVVTAASTKMSLWLHRRADPVTGSGRFGGWPQAVCVPSPPGPRGRGVEAVASAAIPDAPSLVSWVDRAVTLFGGPPGSRCWPRLFADVWGVRTLGGRLSARHRSRARRGTRTVACRVKGARSWHPSR